MTNRYKIGEISKYIGISKDTIRHWQKKGILEINRDDNNYNVFTDQDFLKTFKINLYRDLGFSIANVKELLHKEGTDEKKELIEGRIKELDHEIEQLLYQRNVLNNAIEMPNSRELHFKLIKKTFKLKKVDSYVPSSSSIGKVMNEKQIFITKFVTKSLENHDIFIEVSTNEDLVYSNHTFIHCFYPRKKLESSTHFMEQINHFSKENHLQLRGEMIEVHDLKQLLFNDFDYIEFYIAVKTFDE
ncbi:MerR family transcriptional regulator [Chengkuizengella axinellae]|uniref:MerR family transcriptional regulator n=1 Tax=Chengkuizengella axinellae TaxID=3064388 RepID=A0ABT9J4V2_9BACL|nr:MerR family transcriptional regulator [Chengkuizengella sp. 2205SS18-9]MDP5276649.1 MerR family transcriptional regulator [Chengkuizengella sp. 2205SS18-9]